MVQAKVPSGPTASPASHPRRWLILGVILFGLTVVILDTTVLNVALKTIADPQRGIGASQVALEWALNSYTLAFAGLLITAGAIGDRLGHKRIFVAGMIIFGVGSVIAAYSTTSAQLIGARVLMGIGGAAIMPATLAVIAHVFSPEERARAIGIWGASVGLGAGIGPLLGGVLLEHFWWGSVFLINVFVVIVVVPVALIIVPLSRAERPAQLDLVGVALSVAGMVALVYGIIDGGDFGNWGAVSVWAPIVGGLVIISLFILWEKRSDSPAIDVSLFRSARFSAAVGGLGVAFIAAMGGLFFIAFYLQSVHGLSTAMAGVWMLPFAAAQVLVAPRAAKLAKRVGPRNVCLVGTSTLTLSFIPFVFMTAQTPLWVFGIVFLAEGVGMACLVSPATEVVMSSVPRAKAGAGSGISNTGRQLGGALGVAILGSVLATSYRSSILPVLNKTSGLTAAVKDQMAGSITATDGYVAQSVRAHPQLSALLHPASDAFIHAMHVTSVGAAIFAGLSVLFVLWMPAQRPQPAPQQQVKPTSVGEAAAS